MDPGQTINRLNTVGQGLFAAVQAMGSLKVRVHDSHNHGVQAEILKLVHLASGEGDDAGAARTILKCISQNETTKPLLIRSLASTIGGAPWVQDARNKSGSGESGMANASDAAKTFLALTDGENPPLTHDECRKIHQQLDNYQGFSTEEAPIWEGIQSLSITQRKQLGDCFRKYPRDVYVKRQEYFELPGKIEVLKNAPINFSRENKDLDQLCNNFYLFGISLRGNGFDIPENFSILLPLPHLDGYSQDEVVAMARDINAFKVAWGRFQANHDDPALLTKEKDLCQKFQEARKLFDSNKEIIRSLEEKQNILKRKLSQIDTKLPQRGPISEEILLRRSLMAGKSDATLKDCWNAITNFPGSEFRELGNYDTWMATVESQNSRLGDAELKCENLTSDQSGAFTFEEGMESAGQLRELANWCRDGKQVEVYEKLIHDGIFTELGGIPDETRPRIPFSKIGMITQHLLYATVRNLLPRRTDIPAFDREGQDLGQNVKDVEKYLSDHIDDIDSTIVDQLQQMLAIAKEISA
jgi:hypothetical protein